MTTTPVFVLTGDQDWAPEWALGRAIEVTAELGVPYHVFATSESPLLLDPADHVTIGLHPNFLPGSSHGETAEAVVSSVTNLYPMATTFRTHCFTESTPWLRLLRDHGMVADSNGCSYLQPGLEAWRHASGLLRLPVYLEDDVLLATAGRIPGVHELWPHMRLPGLKVLNFHPALIALNTPSLASYEASRSLLYGAGSAVVPDPNEGWGIESLLRALVRRVRLEGFEFTSFPDVVHNSLAAFHKRYPTGLLGWSPNYGRHFGRRD